MNKKILKKLSETTKPSQVDRIIEEEMIKDVVRANERLNRLGDPGLILDANRLRIRR